MSKEFFDSSEFVVSAPDLQVGLSLEIESGTKPKEALNRYEAAYRVRCAFCAGHTPHLKGFTVELEDGRKALCGICCGRRFFGKEEVDRFAADLQSQITQQNQRRILARTVEGAPLALSILNENWVDLERTYQSAASAVAEWLDLEHLTAELSGDKLLVKRVRNQKVTKVGRDGREFQVKEKTEEIQSQVHGASCLLIDKPWLGIAKGGLATLVSRAERPEMIKGKVADELMFKRRMVLESVKEGLQFVQSAHAFFQEENIGQFLLWYGRAYSDKPPHVKLNRERHLVVSRLDPKSSPFNIRLPFILPAHAPLIEAFSTKSAK